MSETTAPKYQRYDFPKGWAAWTQGDEAWRIVDNGFVMATLDVTTTCQRREDGTGLHAYRVIKRHQGTLHVRVSQSVTVDLEWNDLGPLRDAIAKTVAFIRSGTVWYHTVCAAQDLCRKAGVSERRISDARYARQYIQSFDPNQWATVALMEARKGFAFATRPESEASAIQA